VYYLNKDYLLSYLLTYLLTYLSSLLLERKPMIFCMMLSLLILLTNRIRHDLRKLKRVSMRQAVSWKELILTK